MKNILLITFLVVFSSISCTPKEPHINSFETVWETVNEEHYDPTFSNINWKESHDRFLPRVAKAKSMSEFCLLVNEMLFELKISHLMALDPNSLSSILPILFSGGEIGVEVRIFNRAAIISTVIPGSPADLAGLKTGHTILSVDEKSVEQIFKINKQNPPFNSRHKKNRMANDVMGTIFGKPNTSVTITYRNHKNEKLKKTILRKYRKPTKPAFSALPPFHLSFEAKTLKNNIGYIKFNQFAEKLDKQIATAIESMAATDGIIIDLRGNSGGMFSSIDAIAPFLFSKKTVLYKIKFRDKTINRIVKPASKPYKGKLVILIDTLSTSASEAFAASIQELGRGIVIGEHSPGFILGCSWKGLSNGTVFMYPVAQILTPRGKILENFGVFPNISVDLDLNQLRKGKDSQLNEAIRHINS